MGKTIFVWQTTCDAFAFVKNNISIFIRALAIPFIILCFTSIPLMLSSATSIPFATSSEQTLPAAFSPWLGFSQLLGTLLMVWIVNTCYRISITGNSTAKWWSMRETWTLIWMFFIGIITSICSILPTVFVYFIASTILSDIGAVVAAAIVYTLLLSYLLGRLCVIFPSIAVGERMSLSQTWKFSEGNGWRIIILLGLLPILPMFAGFVVISLITVLLAMLGMALPEGLFVLSSLIVGFLVVAISSTALGLVYKQLK